MPKYKVIDTVTYRREWIVEAKDEDYAIQRVAANEDGDLKPTIQEQMDSTPYEAELIEEPKTEQRQFDALLIARRIYDDAQRSGEWTVTPDLQEWIRRIVVEYA